MINFDRYADAMAVLKHPNMVQALYDDGAAVMADALITLHGDAHQERRVVEFGVFTRKFFRHYEQSVFPQVLEPVLAAHLNHGRADLVELGYRVTMNLTADFAGIDRPEGTRAETEVLLGLVKTFSTGATLVHSKLDHKAVNAAVNAAMIEFDERFLKPSIERRHTLIDQGLTLPNDVLSTLLARADRVPLKPDQLRREIAFFLQAGAHSTANSSVHAMHELFTWFAKDPTRRTLVLNDLNLLQRCVHESLRLHPASPVARRRANADCEVASQTIKANTLVSVDLAAANRDPDIFGLDADSFNPRRSIAKNGWPFGLSFGYGTHACLGRDLDGGVVKDRQPNDAQQLGIVPMLVHTLLCEGATPDPQAPPQADANTTRNNFGAYPLLFDKAISA